jgi:transcriptional regulator with XRE-family HTH domain
VIGRLGFGERLRAHRERQGISLRSIADSTKIKHSLLEALERGNVSQWPQGLYRRAYLRDYATAIGLPPEPLLAEFLRLFPEDGTDPAFDTTPASLQLTLDAPPIGLRVAQRAGNAAVEVAAVAVVAAVVAWSASFTFLEALGLVAVCYYPVAMMLVDRASVLRQLKAFATRSSLGTAGTIEAPSLEPARLYVVGREQSTPAFQAVTEDDLARSQTASR